METKKTILVVEDEPAMALGISDALEFEGFRVVTASTGKQGIALARHEKPNAVLLDLMLPDVNGYNVCEEIRRHDPFVPIIMLTARSQEPTRSAASTPAPTTRMTKPFSPGEARLHGRERSFAAPVAPRRAPRRSRSGART